MTRDKMKERIEQLKAQREQYVIDANRVIGEMNGRIATLEEFLAEMDDKPTPAKNGVKEKEAA